MNTTTTTFAPFSQWQRLDRRYRLLIIATLVIAAALWLGWEWLAAIGALPLLLSLLPCVAMCALGLCMRGRDGEPCHQTTRSRVPRREHDSPGERWINVELKAQRCAGITFS